jgi:hypothetical protein
MPATKEQAEFVASEYRIVKSGPDTSVVAKYGARARKTTEPIPSYFEAEADAQAVQATRHSLLSGDRRRFVTSISGEQTGLDMVLLSDPPTVTLVDQEAGESNFNAPVIVCEAFVSSKTETTRLEVWG